MPTFQRVCVPHYFSLKYNQLQLMITMMMIFQALVLSKVTYALQAFAGHIYVIRIEINLINSSGNPTAVDLLIKFLTLVV